jgi:hypothetical protein
MGDAHQEASRNTETSERQTVTVRGSAAGFCTGNCHWPAPTDFRTCI